MSTTEDKRTQKQLLVALIEEVQELSRGLVPRKADEPDGEKVVNICDLRQTEHRLSKAGCRIVLEVVGRCDERVNLCGYQPSKKELEDAENQVGITADSVCDALEGRVTALEERFDGMDDGQTINDLVVTNVTGLRNEMVVAVTESEGRSHSYTDQQIGVMVTAAVESDSSIRTWVSDQVAFCWRRFAPAALLASVAAWFFTWLWLRNSDDITGDTRLWAIWVVGTLIGLVVATLFTFAGNSQGRGMAMMSRSRAAASAWIAPTTPPPAPAATTPPVNPGSGDGGGSDPSPSPATATASAGATAATSVAAGQGQ